MVSTTRFRDRVDAGRQLVQHLARYRGQRALVLGIPRGGVPVAAEVARALQADLDIIVARKLGAPRQPELAIGAVTANGGRYLNDRYIAELGVSRDYLEQEIQRKTAEATEREQRLRGHRAAPRVEGRLVIVVDDGLATGATMRAALRSVRQGRPSRLVMAVPVGAPDSCDSMRAEAGDVVCPRQPRLFFAVGEYYEDFAAVEDAQVRRMLDEFAASMPDSPAHESDGAAPARSLELEFRNDAGYRLVGTLELPAKATRPPAVVFAHGTGSGRTSTRNRQVAARLLDAGIASFLIDFTGHGDSEGSADEATIERTAQDLAAALDTVAARDDVDASRLGVSGSSSGGIAALVVASGDPRVRALVLRSVPAEGLEAIAQHVHVPTLVIAGERDLPTVREDAALADAIPAEHRFVVVDGAGHLFDGPGQAERVADLSSQWFAEKLAAHPGRSPA